MIGANFVRQADAATFLTHIEDDASTFLFNGLQSVDQLIAAIAAQGTEQITGYALAMDSR